jgi:hypothetical protein
LPVEVSHRITRSQLRQSQDIPSSQVKRIRIKTIQGQKQHPPIPQRHFTSWRSNTKIPMQSFEVVDLTIEYVRLLFANLIKVNLIIFYTREILSVKYRQ